MQRINFVQYATLHRLLAAPLISALFLARRGEKRLGSKKRAALLVRKRTLLSSRCRAVNCPQKQKEQPL
jgi:hypothetical protein